MLGNGNSWINGRFQIYLRMRNGAYKYMTYGLRHFFWSIWIYNGTQQKIFYFETDGMGDAVNDNCNRNWSNKSIDTYYQH